LDVGLTAGWLWRDYQQALRGATLPDCRGDLVAQSAGLPDRACTLCGVCTQFDTDLDLAAAPDYVSGRPKRRPHSHPSEAEDA